MSGSVRSALRAIRSAGGLRGRGELWWRDLTTEGDGLCRRDEDEPGLTVDELAARSRDHEVTLIEFGYEDEPEPEGGA